ncbi:MAG: molybdopterin-dependent oxidoreductase [Paracoccaceae bacterium]
MPAMAQGLHSLTVITEKGNEVAFSIEDLDQLDQSGFKTTTIWTEGVVDFTGVALSEILKAAGVEGSSFELIALNDYAITLTLSDLEDNQPLIATRQNGELMSIREKGPFWMVYPFDSDRKYQTEVIYARSIWQLNRISAME